MADRTTYAMPAAQQEAQVIADGHLRMDLHRDGSHLGHIPELFTARHKFLPFPSSYRLLLQISYSQSGGPDVYRYYFLLVEQWNRQYRIEDLQVEPSV